MCVCVCVCVCVSMCVCVCMCLYIIKKIYIIGTYFRVKGGNSSMAKTVVRENESLDDALRRGLSFPGAAASVR